MRQRYSVPMVWLVICTLSAGYLKVFSDDVRVGFLAHAEKYRAALHEGLLLAPAQNPIANACKDLGYYNTMASDGGAARDIAAAVLSTLQGALQRAEPGAFMPELADMLAATRPVR